MKISRNIAASAVSAALILTTGCVNPDGTQNNTGSGALIGGAVGALAGAATGGRHSGENAMFGALAGAVAGGLIGHMMDEQQQERLRQQSPQTLQTVQHNDQIASQPAPPPPAAGQPAAPADAPTPLKVDDIKALTAAGVKADAVIQAIKESKAAPYSAADIAAAEQANPPVDPTVIAFMKNPTS
jgi:predicted lipid-binding transport protein (Tim44 family)